MKELITKEPFNFSVIETMEPVVLTTMSFMDRAKLYCEVEAKSFYLRGRILQSIKEDKCYKDAGYKTFEKAVKDILDISRGFAYKIMDATNAYEFLCSNSTQNLPTAETQLRPLIELLPEQQLEVWQEVAKDKVPTAKEVQAYVNEKFPKEKSTTKVVHVPLLEKELVPLDVPIVYSTTTDTTIYITIAEHRSVLEKIIAEYEAVIATLSNDLNQVIVPATVEKPNGGISREKVSDFILKYGEDMQRMAVKRKDSLSNKELFGIFCVVRERYKASTPPGAWNKEIIDAEYIIN